jgi:hypothetical protein
MADTVGMLIDKLFTVDMKMWNNQELLYQIRKMSYGDFYEEYIKKEDGQVALWEQLQKVCDLNMQRAELILAIDELIVEMIGNPDLDNGKYIQRPHKTY